ncbi:hypothetical protein Pan44_19860 [Caulifigura coniformis]|uniref:Uncharacterized protein n=1 Tax=Caulifigura coniformis TaxID=2527983 RepID=A0A517SCV8_9PLAN|nr:hypothetical protein [Caulifigura coniformis]QDT53959.1 hypothetical protein Pan44_19860 [Caulifigura coniformis]
MSESTPGRRVNRAPLLVIGVLAAVCLYQMVRLGGFRSRIEALQTDSRRCREELDAALTGLSRTSMELDEVRTELEALKAKAGSN